MSKFGRAATGAVVALLTLGLTAAPAWADDEDPPPSQAPAPGEATSQFVEFSVPVAFSTAVAEAGNYPGDVLAIRFDNPEVTGEYSFGSDVTPSEFEAQFLAQYGTTPAATALMVAAVVPRDDAPAVARATAPPTVQIDEPAFVPPPADFAPDIESMFEPAGPPGGGEVSQDSESLLATLTDWRASQAEFQITNYAQNGPNRVSFIYSFWWYGPNAPTKVPYGFGVEFEVNLYDQNGDTGVRGISCMLPSGQIDYLYKTRLAAANQNWNWRVIRPDGVTAPSSLGAYADYNDLGDACNKSSMAIGLRYPQNIQYVNGAYGIIMVIDAPKGTTATSKISALNQAVSDEFCNVWPYSVGARTDCMGVTAGTWPWGSGPKAQTMLNIDRDWSAPKKCWLTDFTQTALGAVYDQTSWC